MVNLRLTLMVERFETHQKTDSKFENAPHSCSFLFFLQVGYPELMQVKPMNEIKDSLRAQEVPLSRN